MSRLRIAAIRLLCPEPAQTAAFYQDAFDARAEPGRDGVALRLGEQRIELVRTTALRPASPPSNATSFQHFAIAVSDMDAAMARLRGLGNWSPISRSGPERLPPSTGGVIAFKFRDPDGHPLELLQFREDAIPEHWAGRSGLFLGIDHTAITVTDTERSIAFYAGLGFALTSRGVNRGTEQARLDDVDDPIVDVIGLSPPAGAPPHLELLCYRHPASRHVVLDDDAVLATRIVVTDELGVGRSDQGLLHDPDGHRLTFE